MSSYSRVFIVISVLYILTFFSPVFSQNCVPVGEKFNLTFSYTPKEGFITWFKNSTILFTAAVESSGSGCQGGGNSVPDFIFYCEDGGATYIMEITSKLGDKDIPFTATQTVGSLVYTPIVDVNGTNTNLDQCPKRLCDCNQPDEKIEDKFTFSCGSTCTQNHNLILQYQPESGPVQDLENNVTATMMKCNNYADLYNSTFNYIVDSNHAVLGQFNSATNKVRLIVKMVFGGRNETVFETSYFYVVSTASSTSTATTITSQSTSKPAVTGDAADTTETSSTTENTTGSSPGEDCSWCIPVLVPIAVLACVICGCCIYFVICKKKKKEKKEEKKPNRQDEATELKDPKIQQREGEIEKKQENH